MTLQGWTICALAVVSAASAVVMGADKLAARTGRRRVPERSLLVLALMGGWPGIILAMRLFRHKTRDRTFLPRFVFAALVNAAAAAWLLMSR